MSDVEKTMSWSRLDLLARCGHAYHLRVNEGIRTPGSVPMVVGSSVHEAAAAILQRKAEGGQAMTAEELADTSRDAMVGNWRQGVALQPEEAEAGPDAVLGRAIDKTILTASMYAERVAPIITPYVGGIERRWKVRAAGYPFVLTGVIDCHEKGSAATEESPGSPSRVRDLKTGNPRQISEKAAATSGQLTMYGIAIEALEKKPVDEFVLDYAVAGKTTARAGSFGATRRTQDYEAFWARLDRAAEVIEAEAFMPSRPYQDWWCSPQWCGYARTNPDTGKPYCRFFSEAPTFVVLGFNKEVKPNGGKSKRVGPGSDEFSELLDELG